MRRRTSILVYLAAVCAVSLAVDAASDQLLFLQVVWRHGDRTPMLTFKNDANKEWAQGWGELTAAGMARHVKLGQVLRQEYINRLKFLSQTYRQQEMYVHSTDRNRTIISAISNLIGMYFNTSREGVDYPANNGTVVWPRGYIPIAIHTVDPLTEHILDPLAPCKRRDWLYSNLQHTKEYLALKNSSKDLLDQVSTLCGQKVTLEDAWFVRDAVAVEKEYGLPTVFDGHDKLFEDFATLKFKVDNMEDGLDVSSYNDINFQVELSKVRGGGILWDIINHFDNKIFCNDGDSSTDEWKRRCGWFKDLKYYAFSAHDNTITALLTTLGAKESIIPIGYPDYSAALAFELWKLTSGTYTVKMRFHDSSNFSKGLVDVTQYIKGCEGAANANQLCSYETIRKNAYDFYPGDYDVLCADVTSTKTDMHNPASPTATSPPPPQTTASKKGSARMTADIALLQSLLITAIAMCTSLSIRIS